MQPPQRRTRHPGQAESRAMLNQPCLQLHWAIVSISASEEVASLIQHTHCHTRGGLAKLTGRRWLSVELLSLLLKVRG